MLDYKEICLKANQYFDLCMASEYAREQQVVHVITSPNVAEAYQDATSLMGQFTTIKLEHFETFDALVWDWCKQTAKKYRHHDAVSAHVFIAPVGGHTFKVHTDPDDVVVCVVQGEKTMVMEGIEYCLQAGDQLYIPANTPHYAINHKASVMISLGFEKWMVDKL